MLFEALFAAYANFPDDSTASDTGAWPVAIVPAGFKVPLAGLILKIWIVLEFDSPAYPNGPEGSAATTIGEVPALAIPPKTKNGVMILEIYVKTEPDWAPTYTSLPEESKAIDVLPLGSGLGNVGFVVGSKGPLLVRTPLFTSML